MRDIGKVMNAIVNIIPEDFEQRDHIEASFKHIAGSVPYTAPEAMSMRWDQLIQVLNAYVPLCESSPDWIKTLAKVANDEIDFKEYCTGDFVEQAING